MGSIASQITSLTVSTSWVQAIFEIRENIAMSES